VFYDAKKQEILSINPYHGRFEAVCIGLGPMEKDGDLPKFKAEKKMGDNGEYVDKSFYAEYKITADPENNGLFVGCTPRYHLKYHFEGGPDGMAQLDGNADNPKATRVRQMLRWTQVHGIDADAAWPEDGNLLPLLQTRLKGSKPITIELEDGFVQNAKKIYGSSVSVVPDADVDAVPVTPELPAGLQDDTFGGDLAPA
jgi:hypothetical protein